MFDLFIGSYYLLVEPENEESSDDQNKTIITSENKISVCLQRFIVYAIITDFKHLL